MYALFLVKWKVMMGWNRQEGFVKQIWSSVLFSEGGLDWNKSERGMLQLWRTNNTQLGVRDPGLSEYCESPLGKLLAWFEGQFPHFQDKQNTLLFIPIHFLVLFRSLFFYPSSPFIFLVLNLSIYADRVLIVCLTLNYAMGTQNAHFYLCRDRLAIWKGAFDHEEAGLMKEWLPG